MSQIGMGIGLGVGMGSIARAAIETTAPTITGIATSVDGATIVVSFSESCRFFSSDIAGFSVSGTSATLATCGDGPGVSLTLTLTGAVANGETVLLSYNHAIAGITDQVGNVLADVNDHAVTNNVP